VPVGEDSNARTGRIAFARITTPDERRQLPFDLSPSIVASIKPRTQIERYNRRWRIGRVERRNHLLSGRIGYEAAGGVAELWNEKIDDFEEISVLQGRTSPFAVDLNSRRVAFQLRTPHIRARTFTGAFQALMNEASTVYRWRVIEEISHIPWIEWRSSVERITELRFRLYRPNPNYGDRQQLRTLIEEGNAEMLRVLFRGSSLNRVGTVSVGRR
jgi:hypothetical protein